MKNKKKKGRSEGEANEASDPTLIPDVVGEYCRLVHKNDKNEKKETRKWDGARDNHKKCGKALFRFHVLHRFSPAPQAFEEYAKLKEEQKHGAGMVLAHEYFSFLPQKQQTKPNLVSFPFFSSLLLCPRRAAELLLFMD